MNKSFLLALICATSLHANAYETLLPSAWQETLDARLDVIASGESRNQRLYEFCELFIKLSQVADVDLSYRLAMVHQVRSRAIKQVIEDAQDLRLYLEEVADDTIALEQYQQCNTFAPMLRSINLVSQETMENGVRLVYDLYHSLPAHMKYVPKKPGLINLAQHKRAVKKKNTTALIVGGIAGVLSLGVIATMVLMAGRQRSISEDDMPDEILSLAQHAHLLSKIASGDSFDGKNTTIKLTRNELPLINIAQSMQKIGGFNITILKIDTNKRTVKFEGIFNDQRIAMLLRRLPRLIQQG